MYAWKVKGSSVWNDSLPAILLCLTMSGQKPVINLRTSCN